MKNYIFEQIEKLEVDLSEGCSYTFISKTFSLLVDFNFQKTRQMFFLYDLFTFGLLAYD